MLGTIRDSHWSAHFLFRNTDSNLSVQLAELAVEYISVIRYLVLLSIFLRVTFRTINF